MSTPAGLGDAMKAIYASACTSQGKAVLIAIVHAGEWNDLSRAPYLSTQEAADRTGLSRSVVIEALRVLTEAGILTSEARGYVAATRVICWEALAAFAPAPVKSRRGGDKRSAKAKAARPAGGDLSTVTPSNDDDPDLSTVTPDLCTVTGDLSTVTPRPIYGQGVTVHRSVPSPTDPIRPLSGPVPSPARDEAPVESEQSADRQTLALAAPQKPKRGRAGKPKPGDEPTPDEQAAWEQAVGLWAEAQPGNARILRSEAGMGRELLEAMRAQGHALVVDRLRYVVRRDGFASRGGQLSALLRTPKGSPFVRGLDAAAWDWRAEDPIASAQPCDPGWRDPGWRPPPAPSAAPRGGQPRNRLYD